MPARYLDRVRYLGALDDELIGARSVNAEPPALSYVNAVLAQEVLFGLPLALNDGHLFHYEAGRQALTDREASPLLDLIERDYVTILSRNGDLSEMPQTMQLVPSYRRLIDSSNWLLFHQRLRETQRILHDGFNLRAWPRVDLGSGFARLLSLSVRDGRAIEAMSWNGVGRDQVQELLGGFEERLRNSAGSAARSTWNEICDTTPNLAPPARLALRWLALETYHHNFAMAMSTVFPAGGMGVVTRCSDIYGFVQEEPWPAERHGATPQELPVPRLSRKALVALQTGKLLADIITPGTRLNRAKTDYIVAIAQTLSDRTALPVAREVANEYSRLLAEHFAAGTRSKGEIILQVVTAAFGATAGAALGLAVGSGPGATIGAAVGGVAAQGAIAGLVAVVDKYCPVLVQKIRAASGYVLVQERSQGSDLELSRSIAGGMAFASVTLAEKHVAEHSKALPVW